MEDSAQQSVFARSEKLEIDEMPFVEIQIDDNRLTAKGTSWNTFELLLRFIGGAWMVKWKRFGVKMLVAGALLLGFPFYGLLLIGPSALFFILPFGIVGGTLIVVWGLFKRESLRIYTPAAVFKIEGSAGLVADIWKAITAQQRLRDI